MAPPPKDDPTKPKQVKIVNPKYQINALRFSPCGKVLAAAGFDGLVHRFDATSDELPELPPLTGHNGWVQSLAFHPDGKRLLSVDSWGRLSCWAFAEKEPKPLWSVEQAHDGWVRKVTVGPDGAMVATCGRDKLIKLWSPDGKPLKTLAGSEWDLLALTFTPDGKSVVSGDLKGTIRQWDVATAKPTRAIEVPDFYRLDRIQDVGGVRTLTFDPTGKTLLATGSLPKTGGFVVNNPLMAVIDWASSKVTKSLTHGTEGDGYVSDALFHPAGFVIAVCDGQPGRGRLFLQKLDEAQPYFMHPLGNAHAVTLHPNGVRVAVSATNNDNAGNGRVKGKSPDDYPANYSPVVLFDLPKPSKA